MSVAAKKKKVFDNRYEIVSIVGRGSDSVVYHARPLDNPTIDVALKVLIEKKGGLGPSEKLRREALAMVSSKSQYVLQLEDFHSQGPLAYLCLEYAPETDLRAYTSKLGGTLDQLTAEIFLLQAANALHAVHTAGITHRDIKPENILVVSPEEIRLCDFGLALLPGETWSSEELQQGVGTFNYLAPEILEGQPGDERADLYALGITFYELVTGAHPFANEPIGKQFEIRQNIPDLPENIQEPLRSAIMGLIQHNVENRIQSASSLEEKLLGNPEGTDPLAFEQRGEDAWSAPTPQSGATESVSSSSPDDPASASLSSEQDWLADIKDDAEQYQQQTSLPSSSPLPAPGEQTSKSTDDEMSDAELEKLFDEIFGEIDDKNKDSTNSNPAPIGPETGAPFSTTYQQPTSPTSIDPFTSTPASIDAPTTYGSSPLSSSTPANTNRGQYQKPKAPEQDFGTPHDSILAAPWAKQALIRGLVIGAILLIILVQVVKLTKQPSPKSRRISSVASVELPYQGSARFESVNDITLTTGLLPLHTQTGPIVLSAITPGTYAGTINGLVGSKNVPLIVIAHEGYMTFIIGIDGYSPVVVNGNSLVESIKLPSGGKVLELGAQELDGEVVGTYRNITGAETGSFHLRRT